MRRFLSAYRWELLLVAGIPLITCVLVIPGVVFILVLGFLFCPIGSDHCTGGNPFWFDHAYMMIWSVVPAGLMWIFYGAVQRSRQEFLSLVWRCALLFAAAAIPAWLIVAFFAPETGSLERILPWLLGLSIAAAFSRLLVLLWFARQASSYSHAYFLVLFAGVPAPYVGLAWWTLGPVPPSLTSHIGAHWFSLLNLASLCLMVWLLANFPAWAPSARWLSVIGLLLMRALSVLTLLAFGFMWETLAATPGELNPFIVVVVVEPALALALALPLVPLVYRGRVRQPASATSA